MVVRVTFGLVRAFQCTNEKAYVRPPGFTVLEALVTLLMLGIAAVLVVPTYMGHIEKARVVKAVGEIKEMGESIEVYRRVHRELPPSLADLGYQNPLDPWGNPYRYMRIDNNPTYQERLRGASSPLNSRYDLYSMGKDGKSERDIHGEFSRDDIILADDGEFIGPVSRYEAKIRGVGLRMQGPLPHPSHGVGFHKDR
jgi:general secretion pathway protein G